MNFHMLREPIRCEVKDDAAIAADGFTHFEASVTYEGYAGATTLYDVGARVRTLTEANARAAAIRATIAEQRPTWRELSPPTIQCVQWRDNPVFIVIAYAAEDDRG